MSFPLSKSKLQSHYQCPKKLWLEVHEPELAQYSEIQKLILERGTAFGDAVRSLYADGILIKEKTSDEALKKTAELLNQFLVGQKRLPLFEAAFLYSGVIVYADLLVPQVDGTWELIEVKSGRLKENNLRDVAIQALVIKNSGFPITLSKINIGVPNTKFVYLNPGDFAGVLDIIDVTKEARNLFEEIESSIEPAKKTLKLSTAPEKSIGEHCKTPHVCRFIDHCSKAQLGPDENIIVPVWHLSRSPMTQIVQELLPEARDLANVNDCELFTPIQRKMREVACGKRYYLDPDLQSFLANQPFPRYFLDYETSNPPLPLWLGSRPNESIPFQFSVHVWKSPDAPLEHFEFLATTDKDPRQQFAKELIKVIKSPGPIFAWNGRQTEGPITIGLCEHYPAGSDELMQIANNCRANDPLPRFRKWIYFPKMAGDWGLKSIANAVLSTNPYADLVIKNGVDAMNAYEEYLNMPHGPERAKRERDLKRYCGVDTAVMVDIWRAVLVTPASP
jgi:hypothetical protein